MGIIELHLLASGLRYNTVMTKSSTAKERPENAARHCLADKPYRMICYTDTLNGVPRYQVAGSAACPMGAEKALKEAFKLHGGDCFYCGEKIEAGKMTLDHAHPRADGGRKELQNLLLSCRPCNEDKGRRPIELYNPEAGRAWLEAVLAHVQDRLNRI